MRTLELLAGRDDHLAEIDSFLRQSAAGKPVHFSLFGAEGCGKSSLLNGVVQLAGQRGFLAAHLTLREATVESELTFYRAIFDEILQALIRDRILDVADEMMRRWQDHTIAANLHSGTDDTLELGLLIAAHANGRMVGAVPVTSLIRDLDRFVARLPEGTKGIVLCLDRAEHLDDNSDLAPSLLEILDTTDVVTVVTAAETAGALQRASPRAWAQIEVEPFVDPGQVADAIVRPVTHGGEAFVSEPPTFATILDIRELTNGVPYEINLVCHYVWDALSRGEQDAFELSPAVIERVAHALEEKGRHGGSPVIAALRDLTVRDYESLAVLAPFESLTVKQLALAKLMLADYTEDQLQDAEASIRTDLELLARKGVVALEADRFKLVEGDARLYLKYAARQHAKKTLRYGDTYPDVSVRRVAAQLSAELNGTQDSRRRLLGMMRPRELGGRPLDRWAESLCDAAASRDLVTLARVMWMPAAEVVKVDAESFALVSLELEVGLHYVEHVQVVANTAGRSASQLAAVTDDWASAHAELFRKYEIGVASTRCELIDASLLREAVGYAGLRMASQLAYLMYEGDATEAAERVISDVLEETEKLVGPQPADPLVRTQLASVIHKFGFMAATHGQWDAALERFELSRRMAPTNEWLLDYNTGYVLAGKGEFDSAARAMTAAREALGDDSRVLLLAYFPHVDAWSATSEQWNVVQVQGTWVARFVELQQAVIEALASGDSESLEVKLNEVSGSAPPAILRLAAWARIGILDDLGGGIELFERAVDGTPYDRAAVPSLELDTARTWMAERTSQS